MGGMSKMHFVFAKEMFEIANYYQIGLYAWSVEFMKLEKHKRVLRNKILIEITKMIFFSKFYPAFWKSCLKWNQNQKICLES